jgi:hypothetical protein
MRQVSADGGMNPRRRTAIVEALDKALKEIQKEAVKRGGA